ncbi:hypothetical protein CHISP_0601 [Chitinispirillum alkaliphilum]|nr:hypothetical protein CHISP_0601 [Chitinispirillum alkaliphilum]
MKTVILLFTISFAFNSIPLAEQHISGEISGHVESGEYIVNGTVYIPEGEELHISPGVTIFFKPFTGITVRGSLVSEGTAENHVTFTSINEHADAHEAPGSFDWNGIEASEEAQQIFLVNTKIKHSTFGLNVHSYDSEIFLDNTTFINNGYAHIARDGRMVAVTPEVPFSISWNVDTTTIVTAEPERRNPQRTILRISTAALTTAGITLFTVASVQNSHYKDRHDKTDDPYLTNKYSNKFNQSRSAQIIGAASAALSALGFGLTFAF